MCIDDINLGFMFAPLHHESMKHVAESRKKIAPEKTIFNLLGPLTNPANSKIQLIGVYTKEKMKIIAESLRNLGVDRAMIVHSDDGLDEITTTTTTQVSQLAYGNVINYIIDPTEFVSLANTFTI